MVMTLAERAAATREGLLRKSLHKKSEEESKYLSLSKQPLKQVTESYNDDAQSLQRSASSDTIDIIHGIKIPRPTKELSLEELIAIVQRYQNPNLPYVTSMRLCKDGKSFKYYSDGSIEEIMPHKIDYQPFSGVLQKLINWYRNESNLPTAPFTRTTGWISPKGTYNTNIITDHKAYYAMIDRWISLGANAKIATTGILKKELECLKNIVEQNR